MTTFAPELVPDIDITPVQPEIRFQEGVGIILGETAVWALISVLPEEQGEALFTLAAEAPVSSELRVSFTHARMLADALRPPEDTSWQDHGLTDEQMFASWDFTKTTHLHGKLRDGLRQDILPLYKRESPRAAATEASRRVLYGELSDAVHTLAATAIMNAPPIFNEDDVEMIYDAYPLLLNTPQEAAQAA